MKKNNDKKNAAKPAVKTKKKKTATDYLINLLLVCFSCVFLYSGYQLGTSLYESYSAKRTYEDLNNLVNNDPVEPDVPDDTPAKGNDVLSTAGYFLVESKYNSKGILKKYESLYNQNKDMFGWLTIGGSRINYPVMFAPKNIEFYLHRDFYKKYSANGTLYVDESYDPDNNIIIVYGHNMNDGSMFHDLMYYRNRSFYNQHPTFEFDFVSQENTYEVIGAFYSQIYSADAENVFRFYNYTNLSREKTYNYFVSQVKKASLYSTAASAKFGEQLVMFITYSDRSTGRFVVVAKRIY